MNDGLMHVLRLSQHWATLRGCCLLRQQSADLEVEQTCSSERGEELAEVSGLTAQLLSTVQNELVLVSLTINSSSFLYTSNF